MKKRTIRNTEDTEINTKNGLITW